MPIILIQLDVNFRNFSIPGGRHDLVMVIFRDLLKKARKPAQPKLRLDLEHLRDQNMTITLEAAVDEG